MHWTLNWAELIELIIFTVRRRCISFSCCCLWWRRLVTARTTSWTEPGSWEHLRASDSLCTLQRVYMTSNQSASVKWPRRHRAININRHRCITSMQLRFIDNDCNLQVQPNTPYTRWSCLDELALRALVVRSSCSFVNICNITPFKWPDSQLIKPALRPHERTTSARRASSSSQLHRVNGV